MRIVTEIGRKCHVVCSANLGPILPGPPKKTYEYPQLVESYRRKSDGMPTHRVITSLAYLSQVEIENLKAALDASRQGRKVVVASALSRRMARPTRPVANLKYLDKAVLLEMWRQWRLNELFDKLLPAGGALVKPSAVLAALAIHRCIDPGSKLYAERWFPRTALPELLGVAPAKFNNTRVHRVLDCLDQSGYQLMAKLPRLYKERDGAFVALFADVTDTWFVGHGPKIAEHAKTKEGMIRLKVGIVLLCNEHGYPLRWEVIRGKESDKDSIARMAHSIGGLSWVGNAPLVCDRAMGNPAQIRQLLEAGLHFLTRADPHRVQRLYRRHSPSTIRRFHAGDVGKRKGEGQRGRSGSGTHQEYAPGEGR